MIKCTLQTNTIQIKHNKVRIPTGGRLTSWLFTRRGGVKFGATEHKFISSGTEEDLNPGPPDYKSSALPLGHARLPNIPEVFSGVYGFARKTERIENLESSTL